MKSYFTKNKNSGQLMVLTAFIMGVAIITITAVSGVLTLSQIRQSNRYDDSTQALYAADSGVEWELYNQLSGASAPPLIFSDPGVSVRVGIKVSGIGVSRLISIGTARNAVRSFDVQGF